MVYSVNVKDQAHKLIEDLPDEITWEDLIYHFYVQQKLERARDDVEAGRVYTSDEVRGYLRDR